MKIKELRELLNNTDAKFDDCDIEFYHEHDGGGERVYDGHIDGFITYDGLYHFAITTCATSEEYEWHEKDFTWDNVPIDEDEEYSIEQTF